MEIARRKTGSLGLPHQAVVPGGQGAGMITPSSAFSCRMSVQVPWNSVWVSWEWRSKCFIYLGTFHWNEGEVGMTSLKRLRVISRPPISQQGLSTWEAIRKHLLGKWGCWGAGQRTWFSLPRAVSLYHPRSIPLDHPFFFFFFPSPSRLSSSDASSVEPFPSFPGSEEHSFDLCEIEPGSRFVPTSDRLFSLLFIFNYF